MGIPTRPNKFGWVHPLVKETAVGCAEALYERLAQDNNWYSLNRNRKHWVGDRWRDLLPIARTHLAKLLSTNMEPRLKDEIADALIKDNELRLGRSRAQEVRIRGIRR